MGDQIAKVTSDYTMAEARALVAPLVGMDPADLHSFIIVGLDAGGFGGISQTPNLPDSAVLAVLETMAAHMRANGVTT